MSYFQNLISRIQQINSHLCIGIDPDKDKLAQMGIKTPEELSIFLEEFIRRTEPYAAVYKPNMAFFESWGPAGWEVFQQLCCSIPSQIPVIADAKRSDIGSSARWYARAFFELYQVDAITVNPLLGTDSMTPFLEYRDKGIYVLCQTSNPGSRDFQQPELYRKIASWCEQHNNHGNIGMVVGATRENLLSLARQSPCPFLIPGVGAQGGSVQTVQEALRARDLPDVINISRGIMFHAYEQDGYWDRLEEKAREYQKILSGTGDTS